MNKKILNISVKQAMIVYAIAKYSTGIISIVVTGVLSRILTPLDYSVVALVTVFTTFFGLLSDMGLGTGIIQYKDLSLNDINSIYSISIYFSIIISVLFIISGYPISIFYNNKIYIKLCLLLSIGVFFSSANTVPNAILLREKQFFAVSLRLIIINIFAGIIAVVLAVKGFRYYALVIQVIITSFLNFSWNTFRTKLKFRLKLEYSGYNKVKKYSMNQFGYNLILYFSKNIDNLLIGKYIGALALSHYDKAYKLMRYPMDNIAHVVTPIIHPYLSDYQTDKEYIYKRYISLVKIMSTIGVYITIICFWASKELIILFYGNQWIDGIVAFKMLSICLWAQLINACAGSIYQSLGCTKEMFASGKINIPISILMIIIGIISHNINCVALLVSISFIIKFLVETYFLVYKSFKKNIIEYLNVFKSDLFIYIILNLSMYFLNLIQFDNNIISLIFKVMCSACIFLILLIVTRKSKDFQILFKR